MAIDRNMEQGYIEATVRTAGDLRTIATTSEMLSLSELDLPEIERITSEVARVVPAGNVPGMILSGLSRLNGRTLDEAESRKYMDLLFRGVRMSLDRAIYGTFFAGPAAVIYGFQQLLRLAGKDPDSAFPNGTWQFYLEFALREDSARHANETVGFFNAVSNLSDADKLASWMLSTAHFIHQIPGVLSNEWRERIVLKLLNDLADTHKIRKAGEYAKLYGQWESIRPYNRPANEPYGVYRRRVFDSFWQPYLNNLPRKAQEQFSEQLRQAELTRLPAYQRQMSWLGYLKPEAHNETRIFYPIEEARLGIIWQARYYLIPLMDCLDVATARKHAHAILKHTPNTLPAALDDVLVGAPRGEQAALRAQLDAETQSELNMLRYTPLLINWDERDLRQPLAFIRRGKRGIGDHALTIFRTAESSVFDQSHIFFDGAWGAAVAQILTNEAVSWAEEIGRHPKITASKVPYSPSLQTPPKLAKQAGKLGVVVEACAENTLIQMKPIVSLRKLMKQRSDHLARVTVNDLLLLYRALHAMMYRPSPRLEQALHRLTQDSRTGTHRAYLAAMDAMQKIQGRNPAILIPIDASRFDPRERVFPTTFRNPLTDFLDMHRKTMMALTDWKNSGNDEKKAFKAFQEQQIIYLRMIGGFGELLSRYKEIALSGKSTSTASIKFLAHMPGAIQKMLNNIPGRFDILNELIKGEEVFSNLGRVAPGSNLRRFITAKDDNDQKTFSWGIITDDRDMVHISLRDFRPHVKVLNDAGLHSLAQLIVQDYLDAYAEGLNVYVNELREITVASEKSVSRWSIFR